MWGLLANVAAQGLSLWNKKKAADEATEDYNRKVQVNKALAAEQLAITYNSISTAMMRTNAAAYRKEAQIRTAQRQAEGQVAVQAAQLGVAGKRSELARDQATTIPAERDLASLDIDRQAEVDDLIARADMEERATVNRLISNMPDVPDTDLSGDILNFVGGGMDAYSQFKSDKKAKDDAIVLGYDKMTSGGNTWSPRG